MLIDTLVNNLSTLIINILHFNTQNMNNTNYDLKPPEYKVKAILDGIRKRKYLPDIDNNRRRILK